MAYSYKVHSKKLLFAVFAALQLGGRLNGLQRQKMLSLKRWISTNFGIRWLSTAISTYLRRKHRLIEASNKHQKTRVYGEELHLAYPYKVDSIITIPGRGFCHFGIGKAAEWTATSNIDIVEAVIIYGIVELRKIPWPYSRRESLTHLNLWLAWNTEWCSSFHFILPEGYRKSSFMQ